MGCHPSHWRTHIFQDGYCATNQFLCARFVYQRLDCLTMWTLGGLRWMSLWFFLGNCQIRTGRWCRFPNHLLWCRYSHVAVLIFTMKTWWLNPPWTLPEDRSPKVCSKFHHLPPFYRRFPYLAIIFLNSSAILRQILLNLSTILLYFPTRNCPAPSYRRTCTSSPVALIPAKNPTCRMRCADDVLSKYDGKWYAWKQDYRFEMIWLVVWNMNLIFSNISHNYMG